MTSAVVSVDGASPVAAATSAQPGYAAPPFPLSFAEAHPGQTARVEVANHLNPWPEVFSGEKMEGGSCRSHSDLGTPLRWLGKDRQRLDGDGWPFGSLKAQSACQSEPVAVGKL